MSFYISPFNIKQKLNEDERFTKLIINYVSMGMGVDDKQISDTEHADDYTLYVSFPEHNELLDNDWRNIEFVPMDDGPILPADRSEASSYPFGIMPYEPMNLAKAFKRDYHNLISRTLDMEIAAVEDNYPIKVRIRKGQDWTWVSYKNGYKRR